MEQNDDNLGFLGFFRHFLGFFRPPIFEISRKAGKFTGECVTLFVGNRVSCETPASKKLRFLTFRHKT